MSEFKDRRKHRRLGPLVIRAEFKSRCGQGEGYLTNLSLGGAFLAVDETLPRGEALSLRITLPWKLGLITAEAKVVRQCDTTNQDGTPSQPSGIGLQFTDLSSSAEKAIRLYMQRFSELAAKLDDTA